MLLPVSTTLLINCSPVAYSPFLNTVSSNNMCVFIVVNLPTMTSLWTCCLWAGSGRCGWRLTCCCDSGSRWRCGSRLMWSGSPPKRYTVLHKTWARHDLLLLLIFRLLGGRASPWLVLARVGNRISFWKISRNILGMVSVIPRKKVLIPRHSEVYGRVNSEARNGMELHEKISIKKILLKQTELRACFRPCENVWKQPMVVNCIL